MSFIASQRRAQQLILLCIHLCKTPKMIQDIELFLVEHGERVDASELLDVLLYGISNRYLTYYPIPGSPTRYQTVAAGEEFAKQFPAPKELPGK